jgi:hypothetical protein
MNIVAGVDVLQLIWLALALAVTYWLMRLGAGLLAKSEGPVGNVGAAALKIIPGG